MSDSTRIVPPFGDHSAYVTEVGGVRVKRRRFFSLIVDDEEAGASRAVPCSHVVDELARSSSARPRSAAECGSNQKRRGDPCRRADDARPQIHSRMVTETDTAP